MTKPKTKLKVMHLTHTMDKDENGTFSITSKEAPKLRNAVDPVDPVQQAESTAYVPVKTVKGKTPPAKNGDEQLSILKALHSLGGKDIDSPSIGKKVGLDKKFPKSFRGHVRSAMEGFEKQGFVKRKREGLKYSYTITAAGEKHLEHKDSSEAAPIAA